MARFFELKFKFWTDQSQNATRLQLLILALLVVSLIFTLTATGVFSRKYHSKENKKFCFIYLKSNETSFDFLSGKKGNCQFVIVGHSLVVLFLLGLFVIQCITMFVRLDSRSKASIT